MNFLIQFIPVSKLSLLAIGFLFNQALPENLQSLLLLLLLFLSFLFFFISGYLRVSAIVLGFLLGLCQSIHNKQIILENIGNIQLIDFENLKKHNKIQIHFKKEVKRNFFETEIYFNNTKFHSITKRMRKDIYLPVYLCDSEYFSFTEVTPDKEYFRFLESFKFIYTEIKESKCKLLSKTTDPKKLLRKNVEDLLLRAGITDFANDIAMGLYFGDSNYLDYAFKERVREGGILHLFAASGLHIGVLIGFLYIISKRIWFFNYYLERIFPLVLAFSYLYILNFPVSLLRAYIFSSILVFGSLFFRKMKSIDLILVSASFILVFDRESFLTLSFTLSYSAVCGILFLKKFLDNLLFGKWKNFFTENFTISISASLGTYPVLLFYFKTFSFGSIFLNLILVPLTSLLLPLLYISLTLQSLYDLFMGTIFETMILIMPREFFKLKAILDWISLVWSGLIEIFWVYSELLLRLLALLSDILSQSVGFYRSVLESYTFHMGFYILLLFILCIGFIILDSKYFKENKTNSRNKGFLFSIFYLLCILCFFFFGYILFPEKNKSKSLSKNISAGSDYYLVKEGKSIYLGGICKYSQFKIQKILNQNFCDSTIESIFIEEETCLALANLCKKNTIDAKVYSAKQFADWEKAYSYLSVNSNASKKKFSNLIVFQPHIDSLYLLQKNAKTENGNILLLFAYKLNDTAKDWNANKNVLGINRNWNFITPDEL